MTDLFKFYEQLKMVNFCPQNDLLPEKQDILKLVPDSSLVFQQLKIKSSPLE